MAQILQFTPLQGGDWVLPLFNKPLTQVLPPTVLSLGAVNQRAVRGSGLVLFTLPPLSFNPGAASSSSLSHVCSFSFHQYYIF